MNTQPKKAKVTKQRLVKNGLRINVNMPNLKQS